MNNDENDLKIIFKISDVVEYEVSKDGLVTVLEKQDHWIQKFVRKLKVNIPMYKKIILDEYSSYVFLQIDSEKTVKEIGESLDFKYGEKSHPIYERLLLFLDYIESSCKYIERIN
ncbi:PqqD family peptide modification chaperone [Faecalimicrobium sp. JNUCC 81]